MKEFTKNIVSLSTKGGYTLQQVMNNKNCSKDPKYWYNIEGTSRYLFKSSTAESWEFFDPEIVNPIRNTNQIYIKFKDVSEFVEPSNHFRRHKCYTLFQDETIGYEKYWDDLEEKIEFGFEFDGVRITGRHFFAINFGRFRVIPVDEHGYATSKTKKWEFLRFLDHQYYLFHELEECSLSGIYGVWKKYKDWFPDKTNDDFQDLTLQSFVLAKARRKGWTAIIAAGMFIKNITFHESSMNILAAYEKAHYGPMLKSVHQTKTFIDKNTPWVRVTDIKGTREHFITGIDTKDENGVPIQEGYLSEFNAESFKDNPFKGIGDTADLINIEEAGKFNRLLETYPISVEPLVRDGENRTGMAIIGGTAGDMESGGSIGLATMMADPMAYGCKVYSNIYEEVETLSDCGWFIDDMWYLPLRVSKERILELNNSERTVRLLNQFKGAYIELSDNLGNSYRYFAELIMDAKREKTRKTDVVTYQKFITQQPKYLSEAFLLNESSPFDTATAKEALGQLMTTQFTSAVPGKFVKDVEGEIQWKVDFDLRPVNTYPFTEDNKTGCWVMYQDRKLEKRKIFDEKGQEATIEEVQSWRYVAGCDPIDWGSGESSKEGKSKHSLAATYVVDTRTRSIVAEYIGRPRTSEDYFEQLWRGLEYYNGLLLYENNLKGLFSFFKTKNKLYLLANEPMSLKDVHGYKPDSKIKGYHATLSANNYARELIHRWTLEEIPLKQNEEDGQVVFIQRMYTIPSVGLLQEIIRWNSQANFDRISGFGATMILLFDRDYTEADEEEKKPAGVLHSGIFQRVKDHTANKKERYFKNLYR